MKSNTKLRRRQDPDECAQRQSVASHFAEESCGGANKTMPHSSGNTNCIKMFYKHTTINTQLKRHGSASQSKKINSLQIFRMVGYFLKLNIEIDKFVFKFCDDCIFGIIIRQLFKSKLEI